MTKIKIGDIFEINTSKGKAYIHLIYEDKDSVELVRVLSGLYHERPVNFETIAKQKEQFIVSFPLKVAVKKRIVARVGNFNKENFEKPKYMRTEHHIQGEFLGWHIIDTDSWKRQLVQKLNTEQLNLSPWGVWNDTLLIERLSQGWNLKDWH
jgi:hypothetical protein